MAQTLDALVVELRADIRGLQASLRTATGDIQKFSGTAERHTSVLTGAIGKARTAFLAFGGAWAAFRVDKDIMDAGMQMKALQNRMLAATGDAELAAASLAYVRAEAERLGQDVRVAADGFASFSASALRSGLTFGQTKEIFTGISEAATALHLPAERVKLVFAALSQMAAKGVISMEELRQQLGESMPGAFEIAAKAMGMTTAEFSKMVANGEVLSSEFLPKFAAAVRQEMAGSLDEATNSAQASFARLGNTFFELKAKMADAGLLDAVTDAVRNLTTALNDPATQSGLIQFARLLGDIAGAAVKVTSALGAAYSAIDRGIDKAGDKVFGGLFGQRGLDALNAARQEKARRNGGGLPAASPAPLSPNLQSGGLIGGPGTNAGTGGLTYQGGGMMQSTSFLPEMNLQSVGLNSKTGGGQTFDGDKALSMQELFAMEQQYRDDTLAAETDFWTARNALQGDSLSEAQSALEGFLGIRLRTFEQIGQDEIGAQADRFRTTLQQAAQHNKTFFMLEKAAAIARALISARESVVSAFNWGMRSGGPPLAFAFAGIAAAAQAANIAAIASTSFGGSGEGGGGGSVSSTSTGANQPADNLGRPIPARQVVISLEGRDSTVFSKSQVRELLEQMNDALRDGSRLDVVTVT